MACLRDGFQHDKLLDNRFLTISPLNHGSFGMVFTAKDTWTGNEVAVKCITKPGALDQTNCPAAFAVDDRSEELSIHSELPQHPNIVNLVHNFETEHHQYMVLELCSNGDLYEAIRVGKGPLETEHVREFMLQLVDAIDHLHSNGVFHRDIKPENIFLGSDGSAKLGDFGLATTETWSTEFAVGSDRYMAPEQFDASVYGYGYSPSSADVWAIGIVLLNVLFQRNPFATPTHKDPLFADFVSDRQSLFDVFPNMSQDTYNVIRHSLALDPANRSLGAVREALKSVLSFTIDDESLDEFSTESPDLVPVATHAREPLRTPSISSPNMSGDSFPWHTAGLKTPQKPVRQLSTIHDNESDLFPGSVKSSKWQYVDTDEASLSSALDSGLGMSFKSTKSSNTLASKKSNNFVGSLPISFSRPSKDTSPYGANGFSKSWSDLWDEEEELAAEGRSSFDVGMDISRVSTAKPGTPQLAAIIEDGRGSVTPRQQHAELASNGRSSGATTPMLSSKEDKAELPKQRSASILDKWAALGNFRRAKQQEAPAPAPTPIVAPVPTTIPVTVSATPPQKTKYTDALSFGSFTPFGNSSKKATKSKSRERAGSWRPGSSPAPSRQRSSSASSRNWERRERDHSPTDAPPVPAVPTQWSLDNDWRNPKPRTTSAKPSPIPTGMSTGKGLRNQRSMRFDNQKKDTKKEDKDFLSSLAFDDSDGEDFELMVGGLRGDFHV